jgi:DNA polymerase III subunit alpha
MSKFVHLHVHSHYSLLNGLTKVKPLVKAAKERGFDAISLIDTGAMYGAIEFYQACLKEDIKPLIGAELYHGPRTRFDKDLEKDKDIYQLVLLAETFDGYQNLMRLISRSHLEGFHNGKPRFDAELLKELHTGIIALSGNITGIIPSLLKNGKYEEAKQKAIEFNEIFGQDYFYLELEDHPAIEGQLAVNNELIKLSKETGIPMVVTRDVHYLNTDDADAQDILLCIGKGWKVGQTNREDYRHVDRSFNTADDIISRFRHVPEAIENTLKIRDRINFEIPLNNWHFAPVDLPPNKTSDEHLKDEAYASVTRYYPELTDELTERIEYELDIIKTKGYAPYFICVADYVRYAKSNGIVESTRGSAAGSLVSYVLGITTVDPMRFKLPFERFLNPFRPSAPDVDTDFADDRREEMIEYVTEKYGRDKVAQIITFGTMAARASARDVGRVLGLSYNFCDQVSKLIPPGAQGFPMTIKRALMEEPDLKQLFETNEDVTKLLTLAMQVEGCARHTSIHAAGVVISPTPLTDFCPVQRESGGDKIVTQYEMKSVETAGVLKNDFLGIRNLAILGNAVEIVKATTGDIVDIYNIPLDEKSVFEMLARGETMGVFQMSGSGMTRWLKELKPTNINDIMAMVALYRPGPMESIPEYIRRKYNPETITYFDPRLKKILEASFGLLVYQDDVMLTAIELAGYDWMEADKFRKAMGKKVPEEMAKQKIKFYDGCKNHGKLDKKIIDEMWHAIEPFAAYGFNKAHAASYGMVSYQTAYMKALYPVQYMTAVLAAEFGDSDKVAAIASECRRMDVTVLPPDVNESFKNFAMVSKQGEPGRIRFGLTAVKNVGSHICEVIYRERKENGQYKDLEDLLNRVNDKDLNKKSVQSLIKAGAMDCFGHDRGLLIANMENILSYVKYNREKEGSSQESLFAGTDIAFDNKVTLKPAAEATMDEKLVWEKNLLGIYVSSHPFAKYEPYLEDVVTDLSEIEDCKRDDWVVVGGVIDKLMKKITKKGSVMMFVTLQDQTGSMELLVFPKTYETTKAVWQQGAVACIVGKTPREEGDNKIFVENVHILSPENVQNVAGQLRMGASHATKKEEKKQKSISLILSKEDLKEKGQELRKLISENRGDYDVYIKVGMNTIKTPTMVSWNEEVQKKLYNYIGKESIIVHE